MKRILLVTISGSDEDFEEFVTMLREQRIGHYATSRAREPTLWSTPDEKLKECLEPFHPFDRQFWVDTLVMTLVSTVIVALTKEGVKATVKWLKERRKKGLENPQLKITVEGNILSLNQKNMKTLARILEKGFQKENDQG